MPTNPAPEHCWCLQVFKKVGAVAGRLLLIPGIVEACPDLMHHVWE